MNSISTFAAVLVLLCSCASPLPVGAALVHQWTFNDGTANDSIGTANGILQGDATISAGEVHLSGGSGATSRVVLPGPEIAINTYSGVTFEAWWTVDYITYWAKVFSFGDSVPGFGPTAGWERIGQQYIFADSSIDVTGHVGVSISDGTDGDPFTEEVDAFPSPAVPSAFGIQRHLAVTVDATNMKLYIDGVLRAQSALASQPSFPTLGELSNNFAYLGGSPYSVDGNLQGSIDEFRIYDTALSTRDVFASYQAGPVPEPATIALIAWVLVAGALSTCRRAAAAS